MSAFNTSPLSVARAFSEDLGGRIQMSEGDSVVDAVEFRLLVELNPLNDDVNEGLDESSVGVPTLPIDGQRAVLPRDLEAGSRCTAPGRTTQIVGNIVVHIFGLHSPPPPFTTATTAAAAATIQAAW